MGSIWLRDLPDVIERAGIPVETYAGWENRSRSSGGYDAVLAIGIHHDASGKTSSDEANEDWCWRNAGDRPIGCMRLRRSGVVIVGAAGATNTMGKGGPLTCSKGYIPKDAGNKYMIAIEAANNGVGEAWPSIMVDNYIRLLAALCQGYDLDASRDIFTHNSYCEPSCPGRKIDPAGPTPSEPTLGGTSGCSIWRHDDVRALVLEVMDKPPQPQPSPPPEDEVTDDDIERIAKAVWTYAMKDPPTGKDSNTGAILGYARHSAANADAQTKPKT